MAEVKNENYDYLALSSKVKGELESARKNNEHLQKLRRCIAMSITNKSYRLMTNAITITLSASQFEPYDMSHLACAGVGVLQPVADTFNATTVQMVRESDHMFRVTLTYS